MYVEVWEWKKPGKRKVELVKSLLRSYNYFCAVCVRKLQLERCAEKKTQFRHKFVDCFVVSSRVFTLHMFELFLDVCGKMNRNTNFAFRLHRYIRRER